MYDDLDFEDPEIQMHAMSVLLQSIAQEGVRWSNDKFNGPSIEAFNAYVTLAEGMLAFLRMVLKEEYLPLMEEAMREANEEHMAVMGLAPDASEEEQQEAVRRLLLEQIGINLN